MPTLKQRGKSWVLDWYETGARQQKTIGKVGVLSEKEARHILRLKELELDTGKNLLGHAPKRGVKFEDFCNDRYLPWHASEYPDSHYRVAQIFRDYLLPEFGKATLSAIDVSAVDDLKKGRKAQGAAPGTIIKEVRQLKAALNKAVEWKVLEKNEAKHAKAPASTEGDDIHFYTAEQLQTLYAKAGHWAPYWKFLANTGLRRMEAMHLRPADVRNGRVVVRSTALARTKSGKSRVVPLSPGALEALETILLGGDFVLPRIAPASLSRRFVNDAERAGIGGSMHWLRHTFCSHLVMQGTPLRAVQKLAGHSTITITEKYAHLAPGFMDNAVGGLRI